MAIPKCLYTTADYQEYVDLYLPGEIRRALARIILDVARRSYDDASGLHTELQPKHRGVNRWLLVEDALIGLADLWPQHVKAGWAPYDENRAGGYAFISVSEGRVVITAKHVETYQRPTKDILKANHRQGLARSPQAALFESGMEPDIRDDALYMLLIYGGERFTADRMPTFIDLVVIDPTAREYLYRLRLLEGYGNLPPSDSTETSTPDGGSDLEIPLGVKKAS